MKIKIGGILGVKGSREFIYFIIFFFGGGRGEVSFSLRRKKAMTFWKGCGMPILSLCLTQSYWAIRQLFPAVLLKKGQDLEDQRSPPKKHSHRYDLWRLCAPLVCLANTFSSFKTAQMTPPGGPLAPFGVVYSALCASGHSVQNSLKYR